MRNIAVTGSFASGKTYVINCIKNLGYKMFRIYIDSKLTDDFVCIPLENTTFDISKYPYTVTEV